MSDIFWYKLYNELNFKLEIIKEDDLMVNTIEGSLPLNSYQSFILELVSHFIGESRRNMEDAGSVPPEFNDLLMKLNHYFKENFGVDYVKDFEFPLKYQEEIPVPRFYKGGDPFVVILSARVKAFILAMDFLISQIEAPAKPVSKRTRILKHGLSDFHTDFTAKELAELLRDLITDEFIDRCTDKKDFIEIFNGRPTEGKIHWIGTKYEFNQFIIKFCRKFIPHLNHGKWDIVSELFLFDGERAGVSSLSNPGKGSNDNIEAIDSIIDSVRLPVEE